MTKNEFELLRICRSAELAYFMSEHSLEKPKFIQNWFKNKIKNDRDELCEEQVQVICSEWQLKQKTFYKKYRSFVDHFDKVIQNLQYLAEQKDQDRISVMLEQLKVTGLNIVNGLDKDVEFDRETLPNVSHEGLLVIDPAEQQNLDDNGVIKQALTIELSTIDAKRFYYILDIIRLHGFDSSNRQRFVAGEAVEIHLTSSCGNEFNDMLVSYEHGREKDWRQELLVTHNKASN